MSMQATEIIASTLVFEADLNGVEIARQGLLNLTRDINNAASKFTNMFETAANKLMGIAGPGGMMKSITVASVILPFEQVMADLEIATRSWSTRHRDELENFRGDMTKTADWTYQEVARMQHAFATANLQIPEDMDQPDFINAMTEKALKYAKGKNIPDAQAESLFEAMYRTESVGRRMRRRDVDRLGETIAFAGGDAGWQTEDLADLQRIRERNPRGRQIPLEASVAVGQLGPAVGMERAETAGMFSKLYARMQRDAEEAGGIARTRIGADMMAAGVDPTEMMGALGLGELDRALSLMGRLGDEMKTLGGNDPIFTDRQLVIMTELTKNIDEYSTIVAAMNNESGGFLEKLFGDSQEVKTSPPRWSRRTRRCPTCSTRWLRPGSWTRSPP